MAKYTIIRQPSLSKGRVIEFIETEDLWAYLVYTKAENAIVFIGHHHPYKPNVNYLLDNTITL